MSTSGSTDFTLNRDQIITSALRKLRVLDASETADSNDITTGAEALNIMIKAWQLDDVALWLDQQVVVYQQYNTQSYNFGTGSKTALLANSYKTQLSTAAGASATALTVDSNSGIASGSIVGVELDAGTIHWDVQNGAASGSTDITLTTGLASAAAVDKWVFHYTQVASRPLEIIEARYRDTSDNDLPLDIITSRNEFFGGIYDKTSTGTVQKVFYDPQISTGTLYTWPIAGTADITDRIILSIRRIIEDFDSSSDNFDGPNEVLATLIWCLADELQLEYGTSNMMVTQRAAFWYDLMRRKYRNDEGFFFRP